MRIRLDSEVLETACRGCLCHDLPMQFGDGDCCAECGCPKTVEAFHRLKHQSKPWCLRLICCGREAASRPKPPLHDLKQALSTGETQVVVDAAPEKGVGQLSYWTHVFGNDRAGNKKAFLLVDELGVI